MSSTFNIDDWTRDTSKLSISPKSLSIVSNTEGIHSKSNIAFLHLYVQFYSHTSPYTHWRGVSFYNVLYFFLESSIFNSATIIETRLMKETCSPINIPSLLYFSYLISLFQTPECLNKIDMFIIYPIKLTTINLILSQSLLRWNREKDKHDLNPSTLIWFWESCLYNVTKLIWCALKDLICQFNCHDQDHRDWYPHYNSVGEPLLATS